jgi:hypothetical protein
MIRLSFLAFCWATLSSCSSFDPSDPWAKFDGGSVESEKGLAEYEDEDLNCLVASYSNSKNQDKLCAAVRTR